MVLLLGLAVWQVQRAAWKEGLIADRAARMALAPVALPAEVTDPASWEFRRVAVIGRFDHTREMMVLKPAADGRSGYHVITPLLLSDGAAVLVDRGWVPYDRRDPATRAAGQIEGEVRIEGIVRLGDNPGLFTPDNDPATNGWYWLDPTAMAAAAGIAAPPLAAPPLVVEAPATVIPAGLPEGGQTAATPHNRHRGYAVTWSALAVALAVIYLVYRRRQRSPARP